MVYTEKQKEFLKQLGAKLLDLRTQKNVTQEQMAFELGTSRKQYNRIEKGTINTGVLSLQKIAEVLEIDISVLLPDNKIEIHSTNPQQSSS